MDSANVIQWKNLHFCINLLIFFPLSKHKAKQRCLIYTAQKIIHNYQKNNKTIRIVLLKLFVNIKNLY